MAVEVSIVVPVLGDAELARRLLAQIEVSHALEVIVVDGGHDAQLDAAVAGRSGTRLHRTTPGRARQMNAGAAIASGTWLLFLHADSRLPDGWLDAFDLRQPTKAVGGWFRFGLDDAAWQARLVERVVAWRVRLFRLPYGDQGIFVRRDIFNMLDGFRELPLMEDVEFIRRLLKAGPVVSVPLPLYTSSRRWHRDGWFRRSLLNVALVTLYFAGVPPARLSRWYVAFTAKGRH